VERRIKDKGYEEICNLFLFLTYNIITIKTLDMETMDIHARSGHLVTVTEESYKNGMDGDTSKYQLEVDTTYTVDHTEVMSWSTLVFLREFPDVAFNSVNFIDA